ncbi:MAG: monofunctional biosynthetic peptidoglycan transglycosylase [Pedobacter sp.]|nr:MAG: monofunctional biosynthetic peptidoglycan transglycosylase [Pedobacter sp.]
MCQREHEARLNGKQFKINHSWVIFSNLPENLKKSVIVSEDRSFFSHSGFNFKAMRLAHTLNQQQGRIEYGASTITQQIAKNVFLWSGKSWPRKILEAYFTVLIEFFWDKNRILEVYLNIAEFGNGIFGSNAAAKYYFGLPINKLNDEQISLIIAVLPSPIRNSPRNPSKTIIQKAKTIRWRVRTYKSVNGLKD